MKKYASKTLRLISLIYLALPVIYPIWLSLWYDIPGSRVIPLFLSLGYWFVLVICVLSGFGVWEMKRWAWYVFLSSNLFLVYDNAFVVATYGDPKTSGLRFLAGVALVFAMVVRVGRELRVPYFLPDIRWWESDPARKLLIPVKVEVKDDKIQEGEIMDLSLEGCFVKCHHDFTDDVEVTLKFSLFSYEIECSGNVVWRALSTVTHPKGIGVKFGPIAKTQKRRLRIATRKLKELSIFTPVILSQPVLKERVAGNAKA